ncbi:MAG: flagellar basal body rod protein FlgB [Chitinivibrionales bacterium]|nr:flagellar basal body rod protein FlgB [Chitinivibrionales bacterium]MBD3358110.1 flagellar basal body rod protein FlgB [Chitinivibrionales bacterium]
MLGDILFKGGGTQAVLKSLDAATLRHRVIANNIANATTPGFRRVEVKFEDQLRRALDRTRLQGTRTSGNHLKLGRPTLGEIRPRAYRPADGTLPGGVNNVDIDTEMAKLAENQIMYNYGIRFVRGSYRKLNAAIQAKSIPNQ